MRVKRAEIEAELRDILSQTIAGDEADITPTASLVDDLGLDSLDIMEAVIVYEEKHGIEIDDDKLDGVTTFAQFVDAIAGGK